MAATVGNGETEPPELVVTPPSFAPKKTTHSKPSKGSSSGKDGPASEGRLHRRTLGASRDDKHVRLEEPSSSHVGSGSPRSSVYMGSYSRSPHQSRASLPGSSAVSRESSVAPSPRANMSQAHLEHLLEDLNLDLETYGVEEFREGFFTPNFFKPPKDNPEDLLKMAEYTLPEGFNKPHPLTPSSFLPQQWHEIKGVFRRVTTTRAGIKLAKSFLAFFVAYILCLIPATGEWLGRFNYIMGISTIINHPGRPIGAQLDGAFLTILGTAAGLGWGALALYVSDSTNIAANGYGGILATFMVLFMASLAALRSYLIRSYQFVISAGIAIIYTCLADTSRTVNFAKLLNYGLPWLLGQAVSFIVCCIVFPDAGARPLAVALHDAFAVMKDGLQLPRPDSVTIHRNLAWTFVNLSQAYRDLILDTSVTRFIPSDVESLRNLMQSVIRTLLSLKTETELFEGFQDRESLDGRNLNDSVIDIDGRKAGQRHLREEPDDVAVKLIRSKLAGPTMKLLDLIRQALSSCDAVLLDMSGYRKYLGPPQSVSSDILGPLTDIRKAMITFDEEDDALMNNPMLPATFSDHPEVVGLFLFANPIRQAATSTEALLVKVNEMQQRKLGWRLYLPQYPLKKGLRRTNAQVRHDRGGVTAGFYFQSQRQLNKMFRDMQKSTYTPSDRYPGEDDSRKEEFEEEGHVVMDRESEDTEKFRYKAWTVLHRMQGFETRFALKVIIVTTLLSVPAWVEQSRDWYNKYGGWWAVIFGWMMMHPRYVFGSQKILVCAKVPILTFTRVGGNFQDLITRSFCSVLGAVWGGFAYAADNGNPYVMAAFATIYMIPMIYRFTQSSHPRSGVVGCLSFVVVSLTASNTKGDPSIVTLAWTHGVAFAVGVISAILVNWILWPFVARHELRKSISAMILHCGISYRNIIGRYVYCETYLRSFWLQKRVLQLLNYEEGNEPGPEDVARSELLEGRLREGFVRIRQLLALSRHEIRLRGPFDPLPYSALIENCESFFESLISIRQSSLSFHPNYMSDNDVASEALLPFRRDAVACILMNLYVLAGALRGNRKVPRYLPNAAVARKKLLDRMAELEIEHAKTRGMDITVPRKGVGRKFAEVYQFAYSQGLTNCVEQLEQLQKYTKAVCGEVGFDPVDETMAEERKRMRAEASTHGDGPSAG